MASILARIRRAAGLAAVLAAASAGTAGAAEPYPNKPIRLIVPYAAGGGTDISARVIAQHLSDGLGQPVIVENRPGAGTMLGTAVVAKAAADGYTLVYGSVTHTIVPALYKDRMTYDAVKDFTPITQVATFPFLILTPARSEIKSVQDIVSRARKAPGTLNYASVGSGTGTNLTGEMFKLLTKTNIVHVPYNGSGPAMTALLGGQVDLAIVDPPPAVPHLKSGAVRALAVTTPARAGAFPDLPTMAEAGVPGFDFTSWWGIFGPANLPRPIVDRINAEVLKALRQPDVKASLANFSADPVGSTPEAFAETVRSEVAKFDKIVKDANIKLD